MNREFNIIIEKGEDGFLIGSVIELPGVHTQGETLDELLKNIKEAIELYLEVISEPEYQAQFLGIQKVIL